MENPHLGKARFNHLQLSDGSGLAVIVARYETPAHQILIRFVTILYASMKVGVIPDHPLPKSFLKDEEASCGCLPLHLLAT